MNITGVPSMIRKNIFSNELYRMFQLRFEIFNEAGALMDLSADMCLQNDIIEGIFSTKKLATSRKTVLSYDGIEPKRFAILFAFHRSGKWRACLCLLLTTEHGCLGFKATKTLYPERDGTFKVPNT